MKISARASLCAIFFALASIPALAAVPQRIIAAIDNTQRVELPGTASPHAHAANDRGAIPANTPLSAMTLVFARTPAQQAAIDALIVAQQDPASPQYHQFLTPEQFGAQFGVADADISKTQAWLQQQGFTIVGVSRSRDSITFSGTAAQVTSAFGAELHNYATTDGTHFAPSTALTIPSALSSSVLTITNISSFRPRPHLKFSNELKSHYTSGVSGNIFLGPKDLGTIYDVNTTYNAGYNGTGQSIAIVGQTAVVATDITHFQTGFGYTAKTPTMLLVPSTGSSIVTTGDEAESDLDLEYSGAMAPGATLYFVYTGSSTTADVFTSVQYAVQNNVAPIISISYGLCESDLGTASYNQLNGILAQAATQGQTVIAASGDSGSSDCYEDTNDTIAVRENPAADFPSSSQYVTGLGGTEIPSADLTTTYFTAASGGVDVVSSAKSYVPEQVWNDEAYLVANGASGEFDAGGGGTSIYTLRPSWQSGVPGIIAGNYRTVPDVALLASNYFPGYIYCSSDNTAWSTGQTSSCSSGLRDSSTSDFTLAGGTSFAAPIFAGLTAVLNQAKGYTTGQGLLNPTLYTLASNATTYTSAFHDITAGGNECAAGTAYCSTASLADYLATTGYDEASGLGSVDFTNLVTAWPSYSATALIGTTTSLNPSTFSPAVNATDAIVISVASVIGTTVPAGTVAIYVNGTLSATQTLSNGTTTYNFVQTASGSNTVKAVYTPTDITHSTSNNTIYLNASGSVTLTATNVTVASGSSAASTLTVTPSNGYTGTFEFNTINVTGSNAASLTNVCVASPANVVITGTAAGMSSMTIYAYATTNGSCSSTQAGPLVKGAFRMPHGGSPVKIASDATPSHRSPLAPISAGIAMASLALLFSRRSRKLQSLAAIAFLFSVGLAITGCSSNATSNGSSTLTAAPKGTYTLVLTGTDITNANIAASATFNLTID